MAKNVTTTAKRGPGRPRSDNIGDFLRWVEDQPNSFCSTLDDAINVYSKKNSLLWHVGYAENRSAISQAQARLRVALTPLPESAPGKGDGRKEVEAGEFNHLLGTKLFPAERERGKSEPSWAIGIDTMPRKDAPIDGMKHPAVLNLLAKAKGVGDKKFVADSAIVRDIAKMPKRKRDLVLSEKDRDYTSLLMVKSDLEESLGREQKLQLQVQDLSRELAGYKSIEARLEAVERQMAVPA